ncbi:MAG: hypothetical protein SGILL_008940 [Bacillariaceae sp.]
MNYRSSYQAQQQQSRKRSRNKKSNTCSITARWSRNTERTCLVLLVATVSAVMSPTTRAFSQDSMMSSSSASSFVPTTTTQTRPARHFLLQQPHYYRSNIPLPHVSAGQFYRNHRPTPTSTTLLYAATQREVEEDVVQQPYKSSASKERREAAVRALERSPVDSALEGVDAQVLELLSEEFLYPSPRGSSESKSALRDPQKHKPPGRPEMVPGAMTRANMERYKNKRSLMNHLVDKVSLQTSMAAAVTEASPPSISEETLKEDLSPNLHIPSREVERRKTRRGKESAKKAAVFDHNNLPPATAVTDAKQAKKAHKQRIKKNLPKGKSQDEIRKSLDEAGTSYPSPSSSNNANINNLELRKYYATALLTPDQEFDLGRQVQLMVLCEQVHEGLSIQEMRLPTIEEWAAACGFTEEEEDFYTTDLVERQVRPLGAEAMFEETNPFLFVGNGLAHTIGVGRGRGRAKKPPPNQLKPFFELERVTCKKVSKTPVNRGTPSEFVDMILEGRSAKQLMVQSNMRLVVSIAKKYTKTGVGLQDLVQEGSLGLSRAAEKYDPTKGFKFSTWIQQAIFRSIAYHSRTIRLPVHIHNMLNRIRKVRNNLQQGLGRAPTDEEMADAMDMAPSKYKRMIRLTRKSISLELPNYKQNPKDGGMEGEDSIADLTTRTDYFGNMDEENVSPERSVDRSLFHEDLREMLKILNDDENKVIRLRYGLEDGLTRTVTAVAVQMKQTPAWVRSNESKALRKLRRPWYEKKLVEHQRALGA